MTADVTYADVYTHYMLVPGPMLILHDYKHWTPLQDALDEWLADLGLVREGMCITFDSPDQFIMFRLKWG
jgi:hypothetical protein